MLYDKSYVWNLDCETKVHLNILLLNINIVRHCRLTYSPSDGTLVKYFTNGSNHFDHFCMQLFTQVEESWYQISFWSKYYEWVFQWGRERDLNLKIIIIFIYCFIFLKFGRMYLTGFARWFSWVKTKISEKGPFLSCQGNFWFQKYKIFYLM